MRGGGLLFLLGLGSGVLAQVLVHLAQDGLGVKALTAIALYVVSFVFLYVWCGKRGDPVVLPIIAVLVGLGLAEIWRLDPARGWQQAWWIVLGAVVFAASARFSDWHAISDYKYVWAAVATVLLLLTLMFGREVGGAKAWLRLGPIGFQPSEVAKLLVVASLAAHLSESKEFLATPLRRWWVLRIPPARHLGPLLLMWAISMVMFVFQRDLGGAMLLFGVFVLMLFAASNRASFLAFGTVLAGFGGALAYLAFDHVRIRFLVWINPWPFFETKGYQIIQGLFALANGGVFGRGLGLGSPYLVPAAENDFILNALVEELGLLGGTFILAMFMVLVARGYYWATAHGDDVQALMGMGLATLLGLQVAIIVGGVLRLIPVTGITLPFLSYGGSSLLASFAQLGLVYSLSVHVPASQAEGA